jgi:hypothetical protein
VAAGSLELFESDVHVRHPLADGGLV